ncbi:uncharacterized protein TRUGW13939_04456 [Talaromyces rugulosus]|uniref:DNA-directed RNA polymerase III subunit RPC9 n=1 Tax=Talaromyces rugulosus TaxID=121627 RepID=A0A7H8QTM6_TALRU|nr:uncharacterized protein TRUGW13939_04456 [Talaromyces rugulosus]QKX57344.1 hypothetical protein TRUGW13939_04456 [Talaromyces rugulosus]
MKIVDPQTATLTNIEVLSYFTANPPRKSAAAPPGARNFVPKPDLRDHCTVVTEIHNYVDRISPHLFDYPRYTQEGQRPLTNTFQQPSTDQQEPYIQSTEPTPLDKAIPALIKELLPFSLTKAEVMMMINLGLGLKRKEKLREDEMETDKGEENGGEKEGEEEEEEDDLFKDQPIMDTVIEDFSERLNDEQFVSIVTIMRKHLGKEESS